LKLDIALDDVIPIEIGEFVVGHLASLPDVPEIPTKNIDNKTYIPYDIQVWRLTGTVLEAIPSH
jgi:hypothetical protein